MKDHAEEIMWNPPDNIGRLVVQKHDFVTMTALAIKNHNWNETLAPNAN